MCDEVGFFGFGGVYYVVGQVYVYCFGFVDGVWQVLGVVGVGQCVQFDFWLVEFGGVGGVDYVVYYCYFVVVVQCKVGYCCDYWFVCCFDVFLVVGDEVGFVGMYVVEIFYEVDVGVGGEGFFIVGDDNVVDVFVGFESVDGGVDVVDDIVVQCIYCFWLVDVDQVYFVVGFNEDYLGYVCFLKRGCLGVFWWLS